MDKDMVRTSASLPKEMHERVRWIAFRKRASIAEVIRQALREYFENHHTDLETKEKLEGGGFN